MQWKAHNAKFATTLQKFKTIRIIYTLLVTRKQFLSILSKIKYICDLGLIIPILWCLGQTTNKEWTDWLYMCM
jgi:hypothetical protein